MKITVIVSRIILGLGFTVFGLNVIFHFLPAPLPPEGSLTAQFMGVMGPTHWMTLVGVLQTIGGLLVLIGRTAPMGLTILGPILVNILAFHIFLEGGKGIAAGLVFGALEIFLIFAYRKYFQSIFTTNALPE